MIALVSVVGPSLRRRKTKGCCYVTFKGLGQVLTLSDRHLRTSLCVFYCWLKMTCVLVAFPCLQLKAGRTILGMRRWCSSVNYLQELAPSVSMREKWGVGFVFSPVTDIGTNWQCMPQGPATMGGDRKKVRRRVFALLLSYDWVSTWSCILSSGARTQIKNLPTLSRLLTVVGNEHALI